MTEPPSDGRLIDLLERRLPEEWTPAELAWLRGRVRASPEVRAAMVCRVRLEQALTHTLAAPPFVPAQLAWTIARSGAALSPPSAGPLGSYGAWGLGLSILVAVVSLALLWPSRPAGDAAGVRAHPAAAQNPPASEPPPLEAPPPSRMEPIEAAVAAPPSRQHSDPAELVPPGWDDAGSPSDQVPAGFVE
jgi:hypothetical protein